jgi:hypothetical protein
VKGEPDIKVGVFASQKGRHQQKLRVVDPNKLRFPNFLFFGLFLLLQVLSDSVRKLLVKTDVSSPHRLFALVVVVRHVFEVVEDRSDNSLVEQVAFNDNRLINEQWDTVVRAEKFLDLLALPLRFRKDARVADPRGPSQNVIDV